jgi:hypothetical protein
MQSGVHTCNSGGAVRQFEAVKSSSKRCLWASNVHGVKKEKGKLLGRRWQTCVRHPAQLFQGQHIDVSVGQMRWSRRMCCTQCKTAHDVQVCRNACER